MFKLLKADLPFKPIIDPLIPFSFASIGIILTIFGLRMDELAFHEDSNEENAFFVEEICGGKEIKLKERLDRAAHL